MAGTLVMEDNNLYRVIRDDGGRYVLWVTGKPLPAGFRWTGVEGTKHVCIEHVRRLLTADSAVA